MNHQHSPKLAKSALLMLVTRLIINTLGIVSSLVLVRILSPQDFGIAAIAMSLYSLVSLFGDFGLNTALIQKNKLEKSDYDTGFTINLIFGVVACLFFVIMANTISVFFEDPRLEPVIYAVSSLFVISSFKNIKVVDFQIEMNFHLELKLQVIPKLISFFGTLLMAYLLESYWALIFGSLLVTLLNVTFSYVMLPYMPSLSLKGVRTLFNFSKWIMLNNLFYYLNNKSVDLIVGKFISTSAAGIYSISKEMATLPATEIAAPINKASYPAYAKQKSNFEALRELFYQTTSMITVIALPASLGLMITADYFVPTVLGDKWMSAIPVIQLLSVFAFISSVSSNNGYIFLALGKPKVTTLISAIRILSFFGFLFGLNLIENIEGPALALILSSIVNLFVSYFLVRREISISITKTVVTNMRAILSALAMCIMLFLVKHYLNFDVSLFTFLLLVLLGAVFYSGFILTAWVYSGKPESVESLVAEKLSQTFGKFKVSMKKRTY
ncbi:lipopolysaccharide biosynthesis protein [Psychrosphaera haliotis]|uniref:Oligosaccharide flippase family protein n=1 Tax=Psychrosphaera haliotis TaxID=555083 RepID=A0A6N8FB41_9GAMM|nr:lipopolysaccharide biosynthesis protein [Psychrosphaera haliotis]MUH73683.1 oligosaccharide flippase family protein [Psychrosphaera haliotis]